MNTNKIEEAALPFISHLIELRTRLLKIVVCVIVIFLALSAYANDIYSFLAGPLLKPQNPKTPNNHH